jgi:hypothetical protein
MPFCLAVSARCSYPLEAMSAPANTVVSEHAAIVARKKPER